MAKMFENEKFGCALVDAPYASQAEAAEFTPLVPPPESEAEPASIPLVDGVGTTAAVGPLPPLDAEEIWLGEPRGIYRGRDGVERPSTRRRAVIIRPDGRRYAVETGGMALSGSYVDASRIHGVNAVRYIRPEEKAEEVESLRRSGYTLYREGGR